MLQQFQHQYRLMQQHQQQLRNQRQTTATTSVTTRPGQTPPAYNSSSQQFSSQTTQNNGTPVTSLTQTTSQIKLHQPLLNAPVPNCTKDLMPTSSSELDVSEEDLQDLLSHKDLATTLAENLLKHFGSDDIDIKEEQSNNTLSSGPFSPSNMESINKREIKKEDMKEKNKSPSRESILTVKNELPWDFDSLHPSDKRSESEFSITMDARTVLEICK